MLPTIAVAIPANAAIPASPAVASTAAGRIDESAVAAGISAARKLIVRDPRARSCGAARRGALEHGADMLHLFHACWNVENEGAVARIDITRHLIGHPIVAAHEKRADGFVVLERHQPIRVLFSGLAGAEFRELFV